MLELKRRVCLILAFLMLSSNLVPVSLLPYASAASYGYAQEQSSLHAAPEDAEAELSPLAAPEEASPSAQSEDEETAPLSGDPDEDTKEDKVPDKDTGDTKNPTMATASKQAMKRPTLGQ